MIEKRCRTCKWDGGENDVCWQCDNPVEWARWEPATHDVVHDIVKSPKHYMLFPDLEAIQGIKNILTPEEYIGYLKGNALKYRFRAGKKDDLQQDISKAEQYETFLRENESEAP